MTVTSELVSQLGLVLGAVATLAGVIVTTRATRASNNRTAVLNEIAQSRDAWRTDAETLRAQRDADERKHDDELRELEEKFDSHLRECRADRERAARERFEMQSRIDAIVLWCRKIYPILKESGKDVPDPPPGVLETK